MCEEYIEQENGSIHVKGIKDRIAAVAGDPSRVGRGIGPRYEIPILVEFIPGDLRGKHEITLELHSSTGELIDVVDRFLRMFEGTTKPVRIIKAILTELRSEDIFWVHVLLDRRFVTRFPINVEFEFDTAPAAQA
jgi:hypothetical protein